MLTFPLRWLGRYPDTHGVWVLSDCHGMGGARSLLAVEVVACRSSRTEEEALAAVQDLAGRCEAPQMHLHKLELERKLHHLQAACEEQQRF